MSGSLIERRNPSIELMRIAMMLGICFLHAIDRGGIFLDSLRWLLAPFCACVDAFAFISGWYGIRFRPSKVIRLYGIAISCGLIAILFGYFFAPDALKKESVFEILWGNWYLNAYCALMLLVPMIDAALDHVHGRMRLTIVGPLGLLLLWSQLTVYNHLRAVIPSTQGLGAFTFLTLMGVYVLARVLRESDILARTPLLWLVLLTCMGILGMSPILMSCQYSSPVAMFLAACIFGLFLRVKIPEWAVKPICSVSGSMFAVLLMHNNPVGWEFIRRFEFGLTLPSIVNVVVVAIALWSVCLLLDMPRRLLAVIFKGPLTAMFDWIDAKWRRIVEGPPQTNQ